MTTALLALIALVTSMLSAAIGFGGGIVLLAVMLLVLPPAITLPLHGAVQLASNLSRSALMWRSVQHRIALPFTVGVVAGTAATLPLLTSVNHPAFSVAMAIFLIVSALLPDRPSAGGDPRTIAPRAFLFVGLATGAISPFVGATGPFIVPFFLRARLGAEEQVATQSACQITVHTAKILAYAVMGAALYDQGELAAHIPTAIAMSVTSIAGSFFGKPVLSRIPAPAFRLLVRAALFAIAIHMAVHATLELTRP